MAAAGSRPAASAGVQGATAAQAGSAPGGPGAAPAGADRPAAAKAGRVDAEKVLGIKAPKRTAPVAYSAAAKDGSGAVQTTNAQGKEARPAPKAGQQSSDGMNRAQRRAAKKRR